MNLRDEKSLPLLAYQNEKFLESEEGRILRILSEYLEPKHRFNDEKIYSTVAFFGSARLSSKDKLGHYYDEARELAKILTEFSLTLKEKSRFVICSGGGQGIMEAANKGALEAGGKSIGLNISLPHEQNPNLYISPSLHFEFRYFFMRKFWFAHLSKALVVFPGGFGTLDELMDMLTLAQTEKLSREVPVILYGSKFWKEIINFQALVRHGLIDAKDLKLFSYADDPNEAFQILKKPLEM